jgi:hypothetical protein|nr:MAG TPA: RecT protein [Caudoviricetes sp.]
MTDRIEHAKIVAQSSLIPAEYRGKPADIVWAMDIGDALGVPYTQVMQSMVVARGKMTMSADLMGAVVRRAGHKLRLREDGDSVTATLIRADDPDYEFTVTWDKSKAQAAGLWGSRGPWQQYPRQMLRARAITEVCRQGASDALAGTVYTPEELESAPPQNVPQKPAQQPSDRTQRDMTRTILMDYCHETGRDANEVWQQAQAAGATMDDPDSLSAVIDKWAAGINPEPQEEQ